MIRPLETRDRKPVETLLRKTGMFREDEIDIAMELVDVVLNDPDQKDYEIVVIENGSQVAGYLCFGPTPMTLGTWDLYWIAVSPDFQGQGYGKQLVRWLEEELKRRKARLIIIETSSQPKYEPTRQFYLKTDYQETARIPGFYQPGDDRVIYTKTL